MQSGARGYAGFFLVGPTAVGKSAVAQRLAEAGGWHILSADSMLVYKGMDIGTAKPSPDERARVRYWAVDLGDPDQPFSVAPYLEEARRAFETAARLRARLIVVGGSGLYVKALLHGLSKGPGPAAGARARWTRLLEEQGLPALQEALRTGYPPWYEALADKQNGRRLIRALEQAEAGVEAPPRTWTQAGEPHPLVGLNRPRAQLHERIEERVRLMYRNGLLQETERLLAATPGLGPTAGQAIGYAEAADCLRGRCSEAEAIARTIARTRQLAKRQMTWFRRQSQVRWIEVEKGMTTEAMAGLVAAEWEKMGATPVEL